MSSGSHRVYYVSKLQMTIPTKFFARGISILFQHKLRISCVVVDALGCLCNPYSRAFLNFMCTVRFVLMASRHTMGTLSA